MSTQQEQDQYYTENIARTNKAADLKTQQDKEAYQRDYGSPAARQDAALASNLRMKENEQGIQAEKYKVDATTGATVKVANLEADTSKALGGMTLEGNKYAADMGYKGAQLASDTARYGMDKTYGLGEKQLAETGRQFNVGMADKDVQRNWQSGENRADRALQSSLLGFQTSLQMISGGGRNAQTNNYWK